MSNIGAKIKGFFSFSVAGVTLLTCIIYLAAFITAVYQDNVHPAPSNPKDLGLTDAWRDLQQVRIQMTTLAGRR